MRSFLSLFFLVAFASSAYPQSSFELNYSLKFDGIDDRVMVPFNPSFPTEVFTVTTWVRTPGALRRKAIVARGEDSITGNAAWSLYMDVDGTFKLRIEDINDADYSYASGSFIADDNWHHLAATRNLAGAVALYVDGQLKASFNSTGVPSSANNQYLTFGCTHGTFGPPSPSNPVKPLWFFPGRIDEPSMWNVALSAIQVQDLFSSGVDPTSLGLVGLWQMNKGKGQFIEDDSPAGNDGFRGGLPGRDSSDPKWKKEMPDVATPS
jgi:hypothetical protein